jgi:Transposase DDE domain/Domain of unknown function (DUF4372)
MHSGKFVLAQLLDWIHPEQFRRCVARYRGDYKVRRFSCWDQFLCLAFAQLTFRESLRDIEACLCSRQGQLYHLGLRGQVARSTLADANENRDWRIYADLAQHLIRRARQLYAREGLGMELAQTAYALDATTIDLCLSLFPWAHFRRHKGAIKLHTLFDVCGDIPTSVWVTDGKTHELFGWDHVALEANAFYLVDKAYLDYTRLNAVEQARAFFIIPAKARLNYYRLSSHPVATDTGLRSDQIIVLTGKYPRQAYPQKLRRIGYYDAEHDRRLVFLTNHFGLPALTIAQLYRCRWRVELFFKWIKQHLRIKAFYGTSPNAVRTQIWVALSAYTLVAIIRRELKINASMFTILQILSVSLFEKTPLVQLFANINEEITVTPNHNQLMLFN